MTDWIVLTLAASGTAVATGLGAVPVFLLGTRAAGLRPFLWGLAAGSMTVASIVGLIVPGLDDGTVTEVAGGAVVGALFLGVTRVLITGRLDEPAAVAAASRRRSLLVFLVLLVHSLPEGFAIGTAFASDRAGLSLFVILAIALQNVPEGTGVAIPMEETGYRPAAQFWAAVGTSVPQPIGALIAFALVDLVESLLPVSFGFAAGAMLALVIVELLPAAFTSGSRSRAVTGTLTGAAVMYMLGLLIAV